MNTLLNALNISHGPKSLGGKVKIRVLALLLGAFVGLFVVLSIVMNQLLVENLKTQLRFKSEANAISLDALINSTVETVHYFSLDLENYTDMSLDSIIDALNAKRPLVPHTSFVDAFYIAVGDINFFYDTNGWVPRSDYVVHTRPWYQSAIQNRRGVVTFADANTGEYFINVHNRIALDTGQTAVIAIDLIAKDLIGGLEDPTFDGYFFVANSDRKIIYHVNQDFGPKNGELQAVNAVMDSYDALGELRENEVVRIKDYDGTSMYFSVYETRHGGFFMYTAMPASQVSAGVIQMLLWVVPVFIVIFILFFILLTIIMRGVVSQPIRRLTTMVEEVSDGKFNINKDEKLFSDDELGVLAKDVFSLTDVVTNIASDMTRLTHEFNHNGDTAYRIDTSKYKGEYKNMADGINRMTDGLVDDVTEIMNGINALCEGKDVHVRRMKGKKAAWHEMIDNMDHLLNDFLTEMEMMAKNAAAGELETKADISKYQGGWAMLLDNMNILVKAVARPLAEIELSLSELARGVFRPITGDYKGAFNMVKQSFNESGEKTLQYVEEIAKTLGAIARGDLTVETKRDYTGSYAPIKRAFVNILDSLNHTMKEIDIAAQQVSAGASQVSQSATHLAEGNHRQASSVEELNAYILTINEKITQNSERAVDASALARKSNTHAQDGNHEMKSMVSSMEEIRESSSNISKIVQVIEDIALQTNMLALNAAVEAARAGQEGKGFAVVAEEVGSLATRTQQAVKETVALINLSLQKVKEGVGAANSTAGTLETITDEVHEVAEIISQIATMTGEQTESISHITTGINEISDVVQSNSATSEECATASQELNSQAETLKEMVSFFRLKK